MPIVIKRKLITPPVEPAPLKKTGSDKQNLPRTFDSECRAACGLDADSAIPWFLMASYTYYIHDILLLSDGLYDLLAREISIAYDDLNHHHKELITKEALSAGTMYHLRVDQYPLRTRGAAQRLIDMEHGFKIDIHKGEEFTAST